VQRVQPIDGHLTGDPPGSDPAQRFGIPHDGMEPMRRMVRWVLDESAEVC
jgi:hypothetical protein